MNLTNILEGSFKYHVFKLDFILLETSEVLHILSGYSMFKKSVKDLLKRAKKKTFYDSVVNVPRVAFILRIDANHARAPTNVDPESFLMRGYYRK